MSASKPKRHSALALVALLGLGVSVAAQANPTFTVTPTPTLFGFPGQTVGWDFSITNDDPANFMEITSSQFCLLPLDFPNSCTMSTLGSYGDIIASFGNDLVVGPASTASQTYNSIAHTGVGSFIFSPAAPIFATDFGAIVLTYNIFDADPNLGGNQLNQTDLILSTNASVSVQDPGPVPVPEPWTGLLVGAALAGLRLARYFRRKTPYPSIS